MQCEFCGSQVPDGSLTCPNCSAQMPNANPSGAQPGYAAPQMQMPQQGYQQGYQQFQQQGPVVTDATSGNMPNATLAIVLIVIGFLCGIIWGIIGVVQYGPMKRAIEAGDAATASKKFNVIAIATAIGIVLNVVVIAGQFMG